MYSLGACKPKEKENNDDANYYVLIWEGTAHFLEQVCGVASTNSECDGKTKWARHSDTNNNNEQRTKMRYWQDQTIMNNLRMKPSSTHTTQQAQLLHTEYKTQTETCPEMNCQRKQPFLTQPAQDHGFKTQLHQPCQCVCVECPTKEKKETEGMENKSSAHWAGTLSHSHAISNRTTTLHEYSRQ